MNIQRAALSISEKLSPERIKALKAAVKSGKSAKKAIDELPDGVKTYGGFFLKGAADAVLPGTGELAEEGAKRLIEKL